MRRGPSRRVSFRASNAWCRRRTPAAHEVSEQRVVKLDVPASRLVKVRQFLTIGLCEVSEVFDLRWIDGAVEGVFAVAEVVPSARFEESAEGGELEGKGRRRTEAQRA